MSHGSIISLIIFVSLVAFAVTGSVVAMLICAAILGAIWVWRIKNRLSPHFQNLANQNAGYSDAAFHANSPLSLDHSTALLANLRNQLPKSAGTVPLRPENLLFDDLNLDPVALELDEMATLCKTLGLQYNVDEQNPLWEHITTISDLATYITTLKQIPIK